MKLNPKEAPKGYRAVLDKIGDCANCHLTDHECQNEDAKCLGLRREDGCNAIFKKIKKAGGK